MNLRRMEFLLERHRLGEVTPSQAEEVRKILATPEGRRRLEEMEAEDERILEALPPKRVAREIERRLAVSVEPESVTAMARPWKRWIPVPAALAGALAIFAVLSGPNRPAATASRQPAPAPAAAASKPVQPVPAGKADTHAPGGSSPEAASTPTQVALSDVPASADDGTRTKGGAQRLRIHAAKPQGDRGGLLSDSSEVRPGDVVQVSLAQGPAEWVVVLSVDGSGQVTRHIPERGDSAVLASEPLAAPHSFQLDDSPGFERFVLFASPRSFSIREAERILSHHVRSESFPLPEGWTSRSILLLKPEPRP